MTQDVGETTAGYKFDLKAVETDKDKAMRYKGMIQDLAIPITDVLNQASKDGLVISFSFSNQNGHWFLSPVGVHKPL